MGEQHSFISAVMGELSRRKVLRTLGAYAVGVFVVLQLMDAAVEPLRLPEWFPTVVVITLILGFPIVFVLAWQFEITGQGIKRTRSASLLSGGQSFVLFSSMLVVTGGLAMGFYQYYSAVFDTLPASSQPLMADSRTFLAPENSIAVLPFTDLSESGDQAYISDGMAEEILNLLAQVDGLHVAARTSSFAFREPQTDIREIGRALNVRTVLEGSIRSSGNRIRLTAQLINVEDGYHIWSQTFDRELNDVFALQDEVANAIAGSLVESFAGLAEESPSARPQNLAAFEAYRSGRLHWWKRSPEELQEAIRLFAEALEHDPQYAPAYAAIADSWILLSLYGNVNQMRAIERAQPMIEKALALDPESAEAFAALGLARMQIAQRDSSESALRQAIRLNEDYIPARLWLANLLGEQGRVGEQAVVLREAMGIDPLNELLAVNYAGNLNSQGDFAGAQDVLDGLIMVKPDSTNLLRTYSGLAVGNGDLVDGWKYAKRAYLLEPQNPVVIQSLAKVWMELGDLDRARELLNEALEIAADNSDIKGQYFTLLLLEDQLEEAESVVRDTFGPNVDSLPENFQRYYHFQMGLINVIDDDLQSALSDFEQAISPESSPVFDGNQLFALTMSSFLHEEVGDPAVAQERLVQAEQALNRARVNGIDGPDIYYTQSVIDLLNNDPRAAISSLRKAYDSGWRQLWVLEIDGRLADLRGLPEFEQLKRDMQAAIRDARSAISESDLAMR